MLAGVTLTRLFFYPVDSPTMPSFAECYQVSHCCWLNHLIMRKKSRQSLSPLPFRDGIAPSFLNLPAGRWPDLLSFLQERFKHLNPDMLRERLIKGDLVDEQGKPLALDSPYTPNRRIWYYRAVPDETPVPFLEHIIFEDERILVADKPHWLSTIPAGRHLRETLVSRLRNKLNLPELAPSHRLDRETAGLVLLCKDPAYRGAYQSMFQQRDVRKTYLAVAPIHPSLSYPHVHRSNIVSGDHFFTMCEAEGEPNSETEISLICQQEEAGLYQLKPHTGRQHQLRVHLSGLGIAIENDPWYPCVQPARVHDDFSNPLQLLAYTLEFIDPVSGEARFFQSQRQLRITLPSESRGQENSTP
ncbi:tRNA pseudouridine32 synthase / 23S rRNA pseudouridine746 synthase [Oceanospirillum multiglobuliferum]|nr:tRNA pseudouridine32 synthase / 23S rRNA pseudouridine746 synthase [Oceanospirillum multiglobuliferum]